MEMDSCFRIYNLVRIIEYYFCLRIVIEGEINIEENSSILIYCC